MSDLVIKQIKNETELKEVLDLCYSILGQKDDDLYEYKAWAKRLHDGLQPLVYGIKDGKIISAVLGRAENEDSLIIGFLACDEKYRLQGITRKVLNCFEELAKSQGFKYITLGSKEDAFYEKCGYKVIFQINKQNIYQKIL